MESTQTTSDLSSPNSSTIPKRKLAKAPPFSPYLDKSLFLVVTFMLLFTVALLSASLVFQHRNYSSGISAALKNPNNIDHAVIITYSRAWDFAITKLSSIFLSFCLILIGALYVLRAAFVSYSLSMAGQSTKGSLETGSPGLVMLTLGVALMAIVIFSTSKVEYHSPGTPSIIAEPVTAPDDAAPPRPENLQPRIPPNQGAKR